MLLEALVCTGLCTSNRHDGESSAKYAANRALRKHHKPLKYDSHKLLFILSI